MSSFPWAARLATFVVALASPSLAAENYRDEPDRTLLVETQAGPTSVFFDALTSMSASAHLTQMFDSTVVRAHVSAAGAKGGSKAKRLAARAAGSRRKSTPNPTSAKT